MNEPALPVAQLLRQFGLRPDKSLGQNFLHDEHALARITAAAEIRPEDEVLEIGPGLGALTRHLARAARRVVAVELDDRLLPALQHTLADYANVRLVQGDILRQNPSELMEQAGYLVVANIPYYITSAILRHLLGAEKKPRRLVLTMQREVAERVLARDGKMSLLALSVQVYGQPHLAARIPAGAFYPPPKVDSAVLVLDLYPQPRIPADQLDLFFRLIKAGFSQKRKNLRNTLSAGLRLSKDQAVALLEAADIAPQRRAETLTLDEWQALLNRYAAWTAANPDTAT